MATTNLPGKGVISGTSRKKYDVFISYSLKDRNWVDDKLVPRLKKEKIRYFIDSEYLQPGDKLDVTFPKALRESHALLVIISNTYKESANAWLELDQIAEELLLTIIPIRLADVEIPFPLKKYFHVDFFYDNAQWTQKENPSLWDELITAIRAAKRKKQKNVSPIQDTLRPNSSKTSQQEREGLNNRKNRLAEDGNILTTEDGTAISLEQQTENQPKEDGVEQDINIRGVAISDGYCDDDLLGFTDYVEALAQFIESKETQKPITIGIDAPWGGGKTTLMRMLEKRLGPKPIPHARFWQKKKTAGFFNVWFNAWKYNEEESLWGALVLEILDQIGKQLGWQRRVKIWFNLNRRRFDWSKLGADLLKSVGFVLTLGAIGYVGLFGLAFIVQLPIEETLNVWLKHYTKVFAGFGLLSLLYQAAKDFLNTFTSPFSLGISKYVKSPDYKNKVGFIGQFQDDFKLVIGVVTENGKWPLVVFIDDLDRCTPAKAASVIEAINLLLDSQHCIFVIGMDARILSMSIQAKYKDLQELFKDAQKPIGPSLGRHFLEKIIQIDFRIPIPDEQHIDEFISIQLGLSQAQSNIDDDKSARKLAESLIQAEKRAGKNLDEARLSVLKQQSELASEIDEARENIQKISFEEYPEIQSTIREIVPFLKYNPRQIKRFINMYRLQALIAYQRGVFELEYNFISPKTLGYWVLISMRWPDFFEATLLDLELPEKYITAYDELKRISEEKKQSFLDDLHLPLSKQVFQNLINDTELQNILRNMPLDAVNLSRYLQMFLLPVDHDIQ